MYSQNVAFDANIFLTTTSHKLCTPNLAFPFSSHLSNSHCGTAQPSSYLNCSINYINFEINLVSFHFDRTPKGLNSINSFEIAKSEYETNCQV